MAFVKFSNGHVSTWDDTLKVGELITAYHSGYHVLERIEFRDPPIIHNDVVVVEHDTQDKYPPIFHYVKVLSDKGKKSSAVKGCSDASYCRRVTREDIENDFQSALMAAQQKRDELLKFI